MKLVQPTDFEILETLADGKRNNAINIAEMLDRERSYINTRLPELEEYDLVENVGPASNSALYAITERGQVALNNREAYENSHTDFEELIDQKI